MKRLQIYIEEELDEELGRQANEEGTSKAALIRRFVRAHVGTLPHLRSDPLGRMIGEDDYDPESIDDVVYR
jgi:hypothetical protein